VWQVGLSRLTIATTVGRVPGDGRAVVVRLGGELDYATAPEFRATLGEVFEGAAFAGGCPRVVLDIAHLDFCDAAGLGAFVAARQGCQPQGWLHLAGVRPRLSRLLDLTGLTDALPRFPDVPGALEAVH
jgi:anti-anti-sigma factor